MWEKKLILSIVVSLFCWLGTFGVRLIVVVKDIFGMRVSVDVWGGRKSVILAQVETGGGSVRTSLALLMETQYCGEIFM